MLQTYQFIVGVHPGEYHVVVRIGLSCLAIREHPSLDVLVPFLNLNQAKYWLPNRNTRMGDAMQIFLWVYTILGWVFATLGLVAATGLVKRS